MPDRSESSLLRRLLPIGATLGAALAASLVGCEFADIPGLALDGPPVDTTRPPPVFTPQPWLNANSAAVRSIDFTDTDFSDLDPVREAIGDARIVMLGGQSRYDGTTFLAKARLVRFLHEVMGFDVLVFESGAYDMRRAWGQIRTGADSRESLRASVAADWALTQELDALFGYVGQQATGPRPLIVAGVEVDFTGLEAGAGFAGALEAYLRRYESGVLARPEWTPFLTVVEGLASGRFERTAFGPADEADFLAGIPLLRGEVNRLVNIAPTDTASFWFTATQTLEFQTRTIVARQRGFGALAEAIRDSAMANALVWQAQSAHPGRKLIVWTVSSQILRSPTELFDAAGQAVAAERPGFGVLSRLTLGDVIYSLGFLTGTGTYGPLAPPAPTPLRPVVSPLPESWDGLFLATGKPLAFLHLRRPIDRENGWIYQNRPARALNYQLYGGAWPRIVDGFFFTATMAPVTPLP